ncbi:alpha/beta fold hydrolase [Bordetella sp. 2513F-2]
MLVQKLCRAVCGLFLMGLLAASQAAPTMTKSYTVEAPDGVALAVQESGNPDGPTVILVHGLLGSHLNWDGQRESPAMQGLRLITYDMRGHGLSGKPQAGEAYRDGRRWADDLAAVIAATGARQPVLVGWSLGAAVISNYLAAHGEERIGGALYVGGVVELEPSLIVPHPAVYRDLNADDLRTRLDAQREFLGLCFRTPPDAVRFQRLLAGAAMASADMQRVVHGMTIDTRGLAAARKPVLLVYGAQDALVAAEPSIARATALNPRIRVQRYPASGHAPFIEEPDRFNRDLAAFVAAVAAH